MPKQISNTADPSVIIERRFEGPTGFGQGGYTAGVVIGAPRGDAVGQRRASFHTPIPLDQPMALVQADDGTRELRLGEQLIVRVVVSDEDIPTPPALDITTAEAARSRYPRLGHETVPACFSCGSGDSFRVWAGPVGDGSIYATPWTPPRWTASDGVVESRYVWAAIDCPAGAKVCHDGPEYRRALTGSMTAEIVSPVQPDQTYALVAWADPWRGRRRVAGVAMFTADGTLVARQISMWIAVDR